MKYEIKSYIKGSVMPHRECITDADVVIQLMMVSTNVINNHNELIVETEWYYYVVRRIEE